MERKTFDHAAFEKLRGQLAQNSSSIDAAEVGRLLLNVYDYLIQQGQRQDQAETINRSQTTGKKAAGPRQ